MTDIIEEIGTLYLLQYRLASQDELATAWYYFFNVFNITEFTKEDFVGALNGYAIDGGEEAALRSLTDDFNCIIGTYVPRYKTNPGKVSAENNIDCPLGELGLVDIVDKAKKIYRKVTPSAEKYRSLGGTCCDHGSGRGGYGSRTKMSY